MISVDSAKVYRALNGRRYLTLNGAATASAKFKIRSKYPDERADYEDGFMTFPGFYFEDTDWGKVMLRRLTKLYKKAYRNLLNG